MKQVPPSVIEAIENLKQSLEKEYGHTFGFKIWADEKYIAFRSKALGYVEPNNPVLEKMKP